MEEDGRWHLTPKGFLVSNQIIGGLLDAQAAEKQRRATRRPGAISGQSGLTRSQTALPILEMVIFYVRLHAGQWALLFFFYCFCGWVWESCYVSAKQRHWVNRGFLHGRCCRSMAPGPSSFCLPPCRWRTTSGWSIFWVCWPLRRWNMW